jgi:uncharacterized delta-60 repeat protein
MRRNRPNCLPGTLRRAGRLSRALSEVLESRTLLSAGDLDRGFAGDGSVSVPGDVFYRSAADVALQADGNAVLVGTRAAALSDYSYSPGPGDVIVARRNADLTPDLAFGNGGEIRIDLGGDDFGSAVVVDELGRTLVGASTRVSEGSTWTILRYLPDGTPDASFGTGGRVGFAGGPRYEGLRDLEVAANGRIYAAGTTAEGAFSVVAFTPAGELDTTFGGDGVVAVSFFVGSDLGYLQQVTSLATMPDGRVVAAGMYAYFQGPGSTNPVLVARLSEDGRLDASFDEDGKVIDNRLSPVSVDVAVDGAGRVVLAGSSNGAHGFVMRRTAGGAVDPSFGVRGGLTVIRAGSQSTTLRSVAIAADGAITAAGSSDSYDFLVARITADGFFDHWVGQDFYHDQDYATAVALTPQGHAVVAGTVTVNGFTSYGLARFDVGTDPIAGADAHAAGPFEGERRRVYDTVVQPDRKVVVGGSVVSGADFNFYLRRYFPNGAVDGTFGVGGTVQTDFGADRNDAVRSLILQPDGSIVAAGVSYPRPGVGQGPANDVAVARYLPDGSPDPSFGGGDGRTLTTLGGDAYVTDADAYPGGGFVVSAWRAILRYTGAGELDPAFAGDGSLELPYFPEAVLVQGNKVVVARWDQTVERYNADGTRDAAFTSIPLPETYSLNDLALAADGGILALGTYFEYHENEPERWDVTVWGLNPDGTLDAGFGSGGRAIVAFPGFTKDHSYGELAVQPDGKIVAAATGTLNDPRARWSYANAVVRLDPDGTPDGDFGLGGVALVFTPLQVEGLALDPRGDVVVAGNDPTRPGYGVYRLDGTGGGPSATLDRDTGVLSVRGTSGDDRIRAGVSRGRLFFDVNGTVFNFARTAARRVFLHAGDGDDVVTVTSAVASMQVFGGAGNDSLRGSAGRDWLDGGDGNDTLDGGLGNDVLVGGDGTDSLDYRARTADVRVYYDYDDEYERWVRFAGQTGEGDALGDFFEKAYGGSGNDTLQASPDGGAVFGGAGNDTLSGSARADALWGDAGDDRLVNSFGADYFRGGAGTDTVTYALRFNFDPVTLTIDGNADDGRPGEGDNVFTDVENVTGGYGSDRITGSSADNVLDGGAGNDTLAGGGGNDTLLGRQGDDTLNDTQGANTLDGGTGTDTFNGVTEPHESDLLEAEDARLSGVRVNAGQGGYTGPGYADFGGLGDFIEWTYFSTAAGPRTIRFRYANGGSTDRPLELRLNGAVVQVLPFSPTGSWRNWGTVEVTLNLAAGMNTIRLTGTTDSGGNIDSMTVV